MQIRKLILYIGIFLLGGIIHAQQAEPNWSWVREARSVGNDQARKVAADTSGNIYVCGTLEGDPAADLAGANHVAGKEGFLAKYRSDGTLEWAVSIDGPGDQECFDIAVGPGQNIYVVGYFQNTTQFTGTLPSPAGTFTASAQGDFFFAKYNPAGRWIYVKQNYGIPVHNEALSVLADAHGVYVTGYYADTLDFGNNVTLPPSSPSNNDAFLVNYDFIFGDAQWARRIYHPSGNVVGQALTENASHVFVAGCFDGTTLAFEGTGVTATNQNGTGGSDDLFVAGYTHAGAFYWRTSMGSDAVDTLGGIEMDVAGLYVAGGASRGSSGFQIPGLSSQLPANQDGLDMFMTQLNPSNGNGIWARGFRDYTIRNSYIADIDVDHQGSLYLCGAFENTVDFGGITLNSMTLTEPNAFAAKFSNLGTFAWVKQGAGLKEQRLNGISYCVNDTLTAVGVYHTNGTYETWSPFGPPDLNIIVGKLIPGAIANRDTFYPTEGVNAVLDVQANDLGDPGLVTSVLIPPVHGNAVIQNGDSIQYQPVTPDYFGLDSLQYEIDNGIGSRDTAWVLLIIANVDDPQTAINDTTCTLYHTSTVVPVLANDLNPDNDDFLLLVADSSANSTANVVVDKIAYLPNPGFSGLDSVGYSITDTSGNIDTGYIFVFVNVEVIAGVDTSICGTALTLNGSTPPTTGNSVSAWIFINGHGNFTDPLQHNTYVDSLSTLSPNILQWKINYEGCGDSATFILTAFDTVSADAGPNDSICGSDTQLAAVVPAIGNTFWNPISGMGSVTFPSTASSPATGLSPGLNEFEWIVLNGPCMVRDTVAIHADDTIFANPGPDMDVCGTTVNLNGNDPIPLGGTGAWSVISGGGTVTTANSPTSTITGMGTGTNILQWKITSGLCLDSAATTLTVFDQVVADAGPDSTFCSPNAQMFAQTPPVGTGLWTVTGGPATTTTPTLPNALITGLQSGPNDLIWVVSNGICVDTSWITITYSQNVTADAGIDSSLCGTSIDLYALTPAIGSGSWTTLTGGATLTNAGQNNATASALAPGTNEFIWQVNNGICTANDTVSIFRDTLIPALIPNDTSICGRAFTLIANNPSPGTGVWSIPFGGGSFANSNAPTTQVTGLTPGIDSLQWKVTNGTCVDSAVFEIQVFEPIPALAGADQQICGTEANLNANTPSTGTATWIAIGTAPTPTSLNDPLSMVTGLTAGTQQLAWEITNGVCTTQDTVELTAYDSVFAVVGPDQSFCGDSTTLTAAPFTVGNGLWTSPAGVPASPSQATTTLTNIPSGLFTVNWEITNGVCFSQDSLVIESFAPVVADAGLNDSVCGTIYTLNAQAPTAGTGTWSGPSLSFADSSIANTQVLNLTPGNNTLLWITENGSCVDSSQIILSSFEDVQADAGMDIEVCGPNSQLSGTITGSGSHSIHWINSGSTILSSNNIPNPTVSGLIAGPQTFFLTVENGACKDTSTIIITAFDSVFADAGLADSICGDQATLNAGTSAYPGVWSVVSGSGVFTNSSLPNTTVNGLSLINDFQWKITNGACVDSAAVTITVISENAEAGPDITLCILDTVSLSANAAQTGTWLPPAGSGTIENPTQPDSRFFCTTPGTNLLVWEYQNGGCSTTDTVAVEVIAEVNPADAGLDQTYPVGSSFNLNAMAPGSGESGQWIPLSGGGQIQNDSLFNTSVLINGPGVYTFQWILSNDYCPANMDEVVIIVESFMVPDAFSPNDDGKNDKFVIVGIESIGGGDLSVYNRWGNLVYQEQNYANGWGGTSSAGKNLSDDTYYYTLELKNGEVYKGYLLIRR